MKSLKHFAALLCAAVSINAQAGNSEVKKGQFPLRNDVTVTAYNEQVIYEKMPNEMASDWKSDGFFLTQAGGSASFGSGKYKGGARLSAVTEPIQLPAIATSEILYLSLSHDIDVEYYFDQVDIAISCDNGATYTKLYAFTGRLADGFPTGIRLNSYAGKKVQFRLALNADATEQGKGWNIRNFAIVKGNKKNKPTKVLKGVANPGNGSVNLNGLTLELSNVTLDTDGKGTADFYLKEEEMLVAKNLKNSDIKVTVNGTPAGCIEFTTTEERENLNVVFAIDNSSSMGKYQVKVEKTMLALIDALHEKYAPFTALIRFGQMDNYGCAKTEAKKSLNTFDLSKQNQYTTFTNDLWPLNVQDGYIEEYYATLKYAAGTPFSKVEGAQNVIIMLGDESALDSYNRGDCKTGAEYNKNSELEVANYLKEKGAHAFIIQEMSNKSEFDDIVEITNGSFYDIKSEDYTPLADQIGLQLRYKCHISFCTGDQICGEVLPLSVNVDGADADGEVQVHSKIKIARTPETAALGNVKKNTKQALSFTVSGEIDGCSEVTSAIGYYTYGYGIDSVTTTIEVPLAKNSPLTFEVPAEHVIGEKITYHVKLFKSDGSEITSPYVTQDSDEWEFTIGSQAPIISNPNVFARDICSDKKLSVEVEDDDVESVVLYYKNRNDNTLAYNKVELVREGNSNIYSTNLGAEVSRNFFYYIEATDTDGNKGVLGDASDPLNAGYQKPEATEEGANVRVQIRDSKKDGCYPLNDYGGTFKFAYLCEASLDYELLAEGTIKSNTHFRTYDLPTDDLQETLKNGFAEGDQVMVLFTSEVDDDITYQVGRFIYSEDDNTVNVCIPENLTYIDDDLRFNVDGTYNELKSLKTGKFKNGDTLTFGKCADLTYGTISLTNHHYTDIVLNRVVIETAGGIQLIDSVKNKVVGIDETFSFQIAYNPVVTETAKVTVYNNSRQNPLVFYVHGEKTDKTVCAAICQSVTNYNEGVLAEVKVEKNLSNVCMALVSIDGDTLSSDCKLMGGPAIQGFYLSKYGMRPDKEYTLMVRVDNMVCANAFRYNSQQTSDTVEVDNCKELLMDMTVSSWGTMVDVAVDESTATMDLSVYTASGIKTNVGFGPQLMGGPTTHSLYLGTSELPAGSYILRAKVGDKYCARQFVNIK